MPPLGMPPLPLEVPPPGMPALPPAVPALPPEDVPAPPPVPVGLESSSELLHAEQATRTRARGSKRDMCRCLERNRQAVECDRFASRRADPRQVGVTRNSVDSHGCEVRSRELHVEE